MVLLLCALRLHSQHKLSGSPPNFSSYVIFFGSLFVSLISIWADSNVRKHPESNSLHTLTQCQIYTQVGDNRNDERMLSERWVRNAVQTTCCGQIMQKLSSSTMKDTAMNMTEFSTEIKMQDSVLVWVKFHQIPKYYTEVFQCCESGGMNSWQSLQMQLFYPLLLAKWTAVSHCSSYKIIKQNLSLYIIFQVCYWIKYRSYNIWTQFPHFCFT